MNTAEQSDTFDQENATSVGELLKSTRLKSGEGLRDIAGILRINYAYLEAIEEGQFELLPGVTYSLGFVRAYSEYLGLDSAEVTSQLKSQESVSDVRVELDFPKPIPEASVPGGAVIFIGIIISFIAYGAWYFDSSEDGYFSDMIASIPDRLSNSVDQTKINNETQFAKKEPSSSTPKKEVSIEDQNLISSKKNNVSSTENKEPSLQVSATQAFNQTRQTELIQQPKLDITQNDQKKSYPVPQVKSKNSLNTIAKLLDETITSDLEGSGDASKDIFKSAPDKKLSVKFKSNQTETLELPLKINNSQTFSPSLKTIASPTSKVTPSVKSFVVPKTVLTRNSLNEASVVPMDLIPSASPLATGNIRSEQKDLAELSESIQQSVTKNNYDESLSSSDPEKKLLKTTPYLDEAIIVIKAKTTSWIQVRDDTANEILLTRLLREGDSYNVPKRRGLMLSAGNAGALNIFVDGKVVPSIGGIGDVRREVHLDAAKLKAGKAVGE